MSRVPAAAAKIQRPGRLMVFWQPNWLDPIFRRARTVFSFADVTGTKFRAVSDLQNDLVERKLGARLSFVSPNVQDCVRFHGVDSEV